MDGHAGSFAGEVLSRHRLPVDLLGPIISRLADGRHKDVARQLVEAVFATRGDLIGSDTAASSVACRSSEPSCRPPLPRIRRSSQPPYEELTPCDRRGVHRPKLLEIMRALASGISLHSSASSDSPATDEDGIGGRGADLITFSPILPVPLTSHLYRRDSTLQKHGRENGYC